MGGSSGGGGCGGQIRRQRRRLPLPPLASLTRLKRRWWRASAAQLGKPLPAATPRPLTGFGHGRRWQQRRLWKNLLDFCLICFFYLRLLFFYSYIWDLT
uniref:Uncharacterized protein n=1 Tax=Oryza glaberrima TaxID=4538 RepID=I1NZI7_ORYGL